MKKIFAIIVLISLSMLVGCGKKETLNIRYINSFDEFKKLNREDIVNVKKRRFTEGGDATEEFTTDEDITRIYDYVNSIKLGEETQMTCEDNTTVYIFILKDGTNISVEFECNWIVINNKRYLIVK